MKRLLFPHTAIEPALAEALKATLGPVVLLHPLPDAVDDQTRQLAQAQQIELVFPCPSDARSLTASLTAYRQWASQHGGRDLASLMGHGEGIPFFDVDAPSRIAAQIKSGKTEPTAGTTAERLRRARLLLMLAQELDTSRRDLVADFQRLEAQERRMLEALRGGDETEPDPIAATGPSAASPPLHMPGVRLGAWAQLALAAEDFWAGDQETLFLTADAEILDQVADQAAAEPLLQRQGLSAVSEQFKAWLAAPQGRAPLAEVAPANPTLYLTLVRLPGLRRREWLRRLVGTSANRGSDPGRGAGANGLLIGLAAVG